MAAGLRRAAIADMRSFVTRDLSEGRLKDLAEGYFYFGEKACDMVCSCVHVNMLRGKKSEKKKRPLLIVLFRMSI